MVIVTTPVAAKNVKTRVCCNCFNKFTTPALAANERKRAFGKIVKKHPACSAKCKAEWETNNNPVPTIDDYNEMRRAA